MRASFLPQVIALRASLMAIVAHTDALLSVFAEDDQIAQEHPSGCAHPEDKQIDTTTGGGSAKSFFCRGCSRTSDEIAVLEREGV